MNPKHIDEVPKDRRAIAPYNFVELPDRVVEAELPLPEGDRYYSECQTGIDRKTGKIECTLTTESPLYTRCGWSLEEFAEHGEQAFKDLPDDLKQKRANFFINPATQKPIIPGSSIRGMLRTLVEIVSFSKINKVTDQKLIYRAVGDTSSLGQKYRTPLLKKENDGSHIFIMKAGYIFNQGNNWKIQPAKSVVFGVSFARIEQKEIPYTNNLKNWHGCRNAYRIAVEFESVQTYTHNKGNIKLRYAKAHPLTIESQNEDNFNGVLVSTGSAPRKHMEFIFGEPTQNSNDAIPIPDNPENLIQKYREQVTEGQTKILGKDGALRQMQPVFYIMENEKLVFFGHAMMFRLPYEHSPLDFVPPQLRDASRTDIAEAIFGYVDGKKPREKARASRIFITDGVLKPNQDKKIKECQQRDAKSILLSNPKPTTFQHYLVQPDVTQRNLKHYASQPPTKTEQGETPGETVIRGHKLYWHKPAKIEVPSGASDTQTSLIRPIDSGIEFTFTIHFENLSKVELGALLWVLSLSSQKSQLLGTGKQDEKYCFSLGMGKPLGMGAVKIDYELYLSDRTSRYSNLFDGTKGTKWRTGEEDQSQTDTKEQECVKAFEKYVLDGISERDYPKERNREQLQHLKQLPRIEMLLAMLRCDKDKDKNPDEEQTRYMELKEFKQRKVLPTPLDVMNILDHRIFASVESQLTTKISNKSTLPKPKPKNTSERGRDEGGGNINLAFQRPPNKPKR